MEALELAVLEQGNQPALYGATACRQERSRLGTVNSEGHVKTTALTPQGGVG